MSMYFDVPRAAATSALSTESVLAYTFMSSMPTGGAAGDGLGLKVADSFAPGMLTRWRGLRLAAVADGGEPAVDLEEGLGGAERGLALSLRPESRRRDFVLGRLAAREAIRRILGVPRLPPAVEILTGARGEPIVQGHDRVRVSVSHTRGLAAACAWTGTGWVVGIDLERVRRTEALEGTYAFSRRERRLIGRLGDERLAALGGWTVKEASWKALRLDPRDGPESVEIARLDPVNGTAVVRITSQARSSVGSGRAFARVGRLRAAGGDYVCALARTGRPAQNW
jgi:4'-phosphopantetheinyl transferase EntD